MLMQMMLGRFDYETVKTAFAKYLASNSTMPTPADIIKIIEPPVEPRKFCKVTFLDIKRRSREGQFITAAEQKYCNDFLKSGVDYDSGQEVENTMRQLAIEDKQYWGD